MRDDLHCVRARTWQSDDERDGEEHDGGHDEDERERGRYWARPGSEVSPSEQQRRRAWQREVMSVTRDNRRAKDGDGEVSDERRRGAVPGARASASTLICGYFWVD